MKIINKVYYAIYRSYLFALYNIDHKMYMKKYCKFLKKLGVNVVGNPRYISFFVRFDSTDNFSLITICDNCVITGSTTLLTHDYSIWHASVGVGRIEKNEPEFCRKGRIKIGENAFVGANSIILPNVTIGKNSIVGAGSVVTKSVPDNMIVAGNPARLIKDIDGYVTNHINNI